MPTLPISYIYFSWWQLRFTTQHSKYKWCYVKGYISDRFATSKRDFKILVPERFPVPEGSWDTAGRAPAGEGDSVTEELRAHWMLKWSCAERVGGAAAGRWRRPLVPIARWDGTDSEETLLSRETESIRTGGENREGEPRTSGKWRGRVMWGECAGFLHLPLQLRSRLPGPPPRPGGWILRTVLPGGSRALCSRLVSSDGSHLEEIRGKRRERFMSSLAPACWASGHSRPSLTTTTLTGPLLLPSRPVVGHGFSLVLTQG